MVKSWRKHIYLRCKPKDNIIKHSFFKFFFAVVVAMFSVENAFAQEIPNDEIWYTSTSGQVVKPNRTNAFGATIISNTYSAGKGVIKFSASTYYCNLYNNIIPSATVDPEATVKDVIWTSSNPSVLTILDEKTGQAFGMQQGTATITATTTDGSELSASATVYVGDYSAINDVDDDVDDDFF